MPRAPAAGPRLDEATLRSTMLERQGLLERQGWPVPDAIEAVGGLQTQYAPSGYVGLWTRLTGFRREELTAALEDRSVVQATLMRTTIHMVARERFWHYALGVRTARRTWALRMPGADERDLIDQAERLRAALADGPKTVRELGELGAGFIGNLGLWVDLVRVPPSGTWERRRADRLALAEDWIGPAPTDVDERAGMRYLVETYLRAFGPAAWRDIAAWAGVGITALRSAAGDLDLQPYADHAGRPLVDLAGLRLADPAAPTPVRFIPHWDALLLVHARRTGVLRETDRARVFTSRNPFSVGTVLVDGRVAAAWSMREGRVELDPFGEISPSATAEVERERQALEAFHA